MILPALFIAPSSGKGRGVFTQEKLKSGTLVEVSPVIVLDAPARALLDQTLLHDYIFIWGESGSVAVALGYISIYNHQCPSNCEYEMDYADQLIRVKTMRDIEAGEELFINYNGDFDNKEPVWFSL